jgi:hypothetical protein
MTEGTYVAAVTTACGFAGMFWRFTVERRKGIQKIEFDKLASSFLAGALLPSALLMLAAAVDSQWLRLISDKAIVFAMAGIALFFVAISELSK